MESHSIDNQKIVQQVETFTCDRCRKQWEVGWVEAVEDSVEHSVTCDCGRVLKVVRTDGEDGGTNRLDQNAVEQRRGGVGLGGLG